MGDEAATAWLERYAHRSDHPPDDAEKVTVANGNVTRLDRKIPEDDAYGEYIGVAKFSAAGASRLREHYEHYLDELGHTTEVVRVAPGMLPNEVAERVLETISGSIAMRP